MPRTSGTKCSKTLASGTCIFRVGFAGNCRSACKRGRKTDPARFWGLGVSEPRDMAWRSNSKRSLSLVFEIHKGDPEWIREHRTGRMVAFVVFPEKNVLKVGHVDRVLKVGIGVAEEFVNEREVYCQPR